MQAVDAIRGRHRAEHAAGCDNVTAALHLARDKAGAGALLALVGDEPSGDALEARPPECPHARQRQQIAERLAAEIEHLLHRVGRSHIDAGTQEAVDRVVNDLATFPRVGIGIDRIERAQAQNVLRVYSVRVAHPGLDGRCCQSARALLHGRLGSGRRQWFHRSWRHELLLPVQPRRIGETDVVAGQDGIEPVEPARRHGRSAIDLCGAREQHGGRRRCLGKVVRRQSRAALGRRQAGLGPHGS